MRECGGHATDRPPLATPGEPTEAEVEACWSAYYESLRELFERRKTELGYGEYVFRLKGIDTYKSLSA